MGGDVAVDERHREVRARDGTDRDEAREATPRMARRLQQHDREGHEHRQEHPREEQVRVHGGPGGVGGAAVEVLPHESLGELVQRERQRQRGDRDLPGLVDLRQGRHADCSDDRRTDEVRFGREAHGAPLPNLTVRQATDRLPGRGDHRNTRRPGHRRDRRRRPPVNALTVAGWFELAEKIIAAGKDLATRVVVLRSEGKGFNAGVDIKEMQNTEGFAALIGANKGCFAAFAAVYDCPVPLIAAVNGFCVGGGIGLAGNADIVIASDDAFFGLPEVDRGALGAATHLARLVPQHKMRAMVYTGATATAAELHAFGSVLRVVPRDELRAAAFEVAADIAKKSPIVMRAAKESLNGIDLWDVKRSYRFEQGFTFELNLSGVSDELRDAFVDKRDADTSK